MNLVWANFDRIVHSVWADSQFRFGSSVDSLWINCGFCETHFNVIVKSVWVRCGCHSAFHCGVIVGSMWVLCIHCASIVGPFAVSF